MKRAVTFFIAALAILIILPVWSGGGGPDANSGLDIPLRSRKRPVEETVTTAPKKRRNEEMQSIFLAAQSFAGNKAWSEFHSLLLSGSCFDPIWLFPYFESFSEISLGSVFIAMADRQKYPEDLKNLLCNMPCSGSEALQVSRFIHMSSIVAAKHEETSELSTKLISLMAKYEDLPEPSSIICSDEDMEALLDKADKLYSLLKSDMDFMSSSFLTPCLRIVYAVHQILRMRCKPIHNYESSNELHDNVIDFIEGFTERFKKTPLTLAHLFHDAENLGLSPGKIIMFLCLLDDMKTKYVSKGVFEEEVVFANFTKALKDAWVQIEMQTDEQCKVDSQAVIATLAARLMEKNFLCDTVGRTNIAGNAGKGASDAGFSQNEAECRTDSGDYLNLPLNNDNQFDIQQALRELDRSALLGVGMALGLYWADLNQSTNSSLTGDMVRKWLRRDGDVLRTSGVPCRASLITALESNSFNGVARDIREKKTIKQKVFNSGQETRAVLTQEFCKKAIHDLKNDHWKLIVSEKHAVDLMLEREMITAELHDMILEQKTLYSDTDKACRLQKTFRCQAELAAVDTYKNLLGVLTNYSGYFKAVIKVLR